VIDFPPRRRLFPLPSLGPVAVDNGQTDFNLSHLLMAGARQMILLADGALLTYIQLIAAREIF
jgi:hypothetical protein